MSAETIAQSASTKRLPKVRVGAVLSEMQLLHPDERLQVTTRKASFLGLGYVGVESNFRTHLSRRNDVQSVPRAGIRAVQKCQTLDVTIQSPPRVQRGGEVGSPEKDITSCVLRTAASSTETMRDALHPHGRERRLAQRGGSSRSLSRTFSTAGSSSHETSPYCLASMHRYLAQTCAVQAPLLALTHFPPAISARVQSQPPHAAATNSMADVPECIPASAHFSGAWSTSIFMRTSLVSLFACVSR